ncbi:hypothetical protein JOC54_003071 [Alkalihalobacillus xiaoxiensis]|uniref:Uncharacterized protein n=1 Tax=Shouchella xiaoxiensis TaxID=766895 RepID=A0ABS2SX67_9BACI|nr:hypothetical protein [Shouchella xiaoxiensis]
MSQATEKDKLVKVSNSQFEQLLSVMEAIPA